MINLDDFVITRKRKKYKFAKFALADNCFELADWRRRPIDIVEIGAGTGFFSVELAKRRPNQTFLALDVKADRLQKGAYQALELSLDNIWFVRARADQLLEVIEPDSAQELWLTFPDPFPRDRSAGRRLTHATFLKLYQTVLSPGGVLHFKHDDRRFFDWSVAQLQQLGWHIQLQTNHLHDSNLDQDFKIMTSYEIKWIDSGATINLLSATAPK